MVKFTAGEVGEAGDPGLEEWVKVTWLISGAERAG